jgi:hypothetical protein
MQENGKDNYEGGDSENSGDKTERQDFADRVSARTRT